MPRWMMKFEIEGHLGVEAAREELVFHHPQGIYQIHVRNHQMTPGTEVPILHMFVLFDSESLDNADVSGRRHLNRFLQFLSFCTAARFRERRPMCLFDWSPHTHDERHGYVYHDFADPDLPQLVMNDDIATTVQELMHSDDANPDVMQALMWFSAAVSAGGPEEQFQLFWFCIETLARCTRDRSRVPDRCPICREPLHCPKCNQVSTHRPYPSQAIEQLFVRFVSGNGESFFRAAEDMRHALMHGDLVNEVETKHNLRLVQLVDDLGRLAWVALLDSLNRISAKRGKVRLRMMRPSTLVHRRGIGRAHVSAGFALGRQPRFDEIPKFELSVDIVERPYGAEDGPPERPSPYIVRSPSKDP